VIERRQFITLLGGAAFVQCSGSVGSRSTNTLRSSSIISSSESPHARPCVSAFLMKAGSPQPKLWSSAADGPSSRASAWAFRTARIRYVAQRAESCCFFGKSVDRAGTPGFFQADDEGSIPFTRSNVFSAPRHSNPLRPVQKGGALARREYARHGERNVRMIVEERGRATEPAQPPAENP